MNGYLLPSGVRQARSVRPLSKFVFRAFRAKYRFKFTFRTNETESRMMSIVQRMSTSTS